MKTSGRKSKVHQSWMSAITFAEAGEWETARTMIPEAAPSRKETSTLFRIFAAAALAEGGLPQEALKFLEQAPLEETTREDFFKILGLDGFRLTYGVLNVEQQR